MHPLGPEVPVLQTGVPTLTRYFSMGREVRIALTRRGFGVLPTSNYLYSLKLFTLAEEVGYAPTSRSSRVTVFKTA